MSAPVMGRVAVVLATLGGCVVPPVGGFGSSARIPAPPDHVSVEGRTAVGLGAGRQTYQADFSGAFRIRRWFALEMGATYARTSQDTDDGDEISLQGGFPYARPRFFFGDRVSLAIGLAGIGMGGGGGGFVGGIADAQLGYGTRTWSVYGGAYRHYFELVAEDPILTSSSQLRVGVHYTMPVGRGRVGLALELHRHRAFLRDGDLEHDGTQLGAGIKLSFTSSEFR